jgi:hypothetical protein
MHVVAASSAVDHALIPALKRHHLLPYHNTFAAQSQPLPCCALTQRNVWGNHDSRVAQQGRHIHVLTRRIGLAAAAAAASISCGLLGALGTSNSVSAKRPTPDLLA